MRFAWEVEVTRPLDEVLERISDPRHPLRWQPGLVCIAPVEGEIGEEGSVARYEFDLDGRRFDLTETILAARLPDEGIARYEGRGLRHSITTRFERVDATTSRLQSCHESYLTGMARPLTLLLRRPLRERWRLELALFREYLQADGGTTAP